jgi:hypothetical protein
VTDSFSDADSHIDFRAAACLRKWPSQNNERRTEGRSPYLLVDDTLEACIRALMAKPESARHLYEIHTEAQPPLVTSVMAADHIGELARLRDFL